MLFRGRQQVSLLSSQKMSREPFDNVRRVLVRYPLVRHAIVFGSVAAGTARPDSDLDIAVGGAHPLPVETRLNLTQELAEITGRPIDLIDLQTAGEPLMGEILRTGKRLMGKNADHAALLSQHLLDQADFMPYVNRMLAERRRKWIG